MWEATWELLSLSPSSYCFHISKIVFPIDRRMGRGWGGGKGGMGVEDPAVRLRVPFARARHLGSGGRSWDLPGGGDKWAGC